MASGWGANMAQVTVALWALMPSQKSLRSRRTYKIALIIVKLQYISLESTYRAQLGVVVVGLPYVDALILGTSNYVFAIMTKRAFDLRGYIYVALVFARQVQISQIIESHTTVVRCDQYFILSWHWLNATDLTANTILTTRRTYMDLCVILQLVRVVKDATPIVAAHHSELSILTEIGGRNQFRLAIDLIPKGHLLIGYIPQTQLAIETAAQEVSIVAWMKSNCSDEINVLEATKTFLSRDMPQAHRLIHAAR